ncbi:RNase adapter RapZ [Virgibacillus sp. MSP4-1]|uniref:RNase adapter RapZ n=1 Tax=Virgibacillus sp. MSP4-1 TaxID=2700081 RepID=UPI0003AA8E41|nr:RNase adapter RapZ [Virgibacillus sp. MSP4-1]QHS23241.1 RNase adapter RapZ [Virgibacillus sp. MSP4-1]
MSEQSQKVELVIITGMSGAGKTLAVQSFEDLGYFCVDNLPPALLPKFLELMKENDQRTPKVAVVMDLRGREFFDTLIDTLVQVGKEDWISEQILFLEADNDVLVSRYKETRRSHPLAPDGLPLEGIKKERELLDELKGRAQIIIDSSDKKPRKLREEILQAFKDQSQHVFSMNVVSFGFKHGVPIDADLVFDVRFLPNPHYVESMRPLTGKDTEVAEYVFKWSETDTFMNKLLDMLSFMLPQYKKEGKRQLVVGIGCTGGQHRSVAIAEKIADYFQSEYDTYVTHREIDKKKG